MRFCVYYKDTITELRHEYRIIRIDIKIGKT